MTERIRLDRDGAVLTITLNRPEVLNAFDAQMTAELLGALADVRGDRAVRAVVLTGTGRAFCAGADVAGLVDAAEGGASPPALRAAMLTRNADLVRTLWDLDRPIVAAVNGVAAGAGASMVVACDVALMAESASIAFLFARRGLVPDYGATWVLPRLVGLRAARRLCLFGERVDAHEAAALGLVDRVVADDDLAEEAAALARRLAEGPTTALGLTRRLLATSFERGLSEAVEAEFTAQALCFATSDASEGAAAFVAKRPPRFTGS